MSRPSRRAVLATGLGGGAATVLTAGPATAAPAAVSPSEGADLSFPSTRLARQALRLVYRTQQAQLRNHSLRSFLFARAAAAQDGRQPGRDYDVEVLFLICALHDMGLTGPGDGEQRFEVAGADYAARFLEERGMTDGRVDTIWDGIALHTTPSFIFSPVFQRRRAPEISISLNGIGLDLFGRPEDLPAGYADRVHARYPRLGGARALTDVIVAHAMSDPRKRPAMTLPGEIVHQRHPSLPYTTWDMELDSGGWGD